MSSQIADCSIVLIEPKPEFLVRVRKLLEEGGKAVHPFREYHPEENGVYLIRRMGSFRSHASVVTYLDAVKKFVHEYELRRFVHDLPKALEKLTSESFDDHFALSIRDEVEDLRQRLL